MKKLFAIAILFLGAAHAYAITNCDDQAKPALGCPPGYSMMCNPTGGYHWSCGKEAALDAGGTVTLNITPDNSQNVEIVDGSLRLVAPSVPAISAGAAVSSSAETTGVKSLLQTQVRTSGTAPTPVPTPPPSSDACKITVTYEDKVPIYENRTVDGKTVPVLTGYQVVTKTKATAKPDGTPCGGGTCIAGICKPAKEEPKGITGDKEKASGSEAKDLKSFKPRLTGASQVQNVTVRGWDPDKKEQILGKIEAEVAADPNIKAADISKDEVRIDYTEPAKLFWIFSTKITISYSLDKNGGVKAKFPWYRFFMSSKAQAVAEEVKYAFQNNQTNLEFLKLQDEMQRQSEAFNTLSNILKARHDASQQAISNIK